MAAKHPTTHVRLAEKDRFRLLKWLEDQHKQNALEKADTIVSIATSATNYLGFKVTKANVQSALKILDINFNGQGPSSSPLGQVHSQVKALEQKVVELEDALAKWQQVDERLKKLEIALQ